MVPYTFEHDILTRIVSVTIKLEYISIKLNQTKSTQHLHYTLLLFVCVYGICWGLHVPQQAMVIHTVYIRGGVAQWVACLTRNMEVVGSIQPHQRPPFFP